MPIRHFLFAAFLSGALSPIALAQTGWPGVIWAKPPNMTETTTWNRACPGACIMYEGPEDREWPLIVVHAPMAGAPTSIPDSYRKGRAARTGEIVSQINMNTAEQDGLTVSMGLFEIRDSHEDPGQGDFSMIAFLSRGSVTLPVELRAFDKEDLDARSAEFARLLSSVSIDPSKASASLDADAQALRSLEKAIADGYARGERAQMYLHVQAGVRNEFRLGGMQLIAFRDETRLLLLPGGVSVADTDANIDLRKPDLAALRDDGLLGSWRKAGANLEVTAADGTRQVYRPGPKAGIQTSYTADGDIVLQEIARPTLADLVGEYASIETSSSGGGVSELAMIASRSDKKLRLLPGGRFEMTREGFVGVFGSGVTLGRGADELVTGSYAWDPASFMLTLSPDGGAPQLRGRMHAGPGAFETPELRSGGDWTVLGDNGWWRED